MSENAADKAKRLLGEGRLTVLRAGDADGIIHGRVRGDSAEVYDVGYDPRPGKKEWRCNCEARGRCSHIRALQLVTTIEHEGGE